MNTEMEVKSSVFYKTLIFLFLSITLLFSPDITLPIDQIFLWCVLILLVIGEYLGFVIRMIWYDEPLIEYLVEKTKTIGAILAGVYAGLIVYFLSNGLKKRK